MTQAEYEKSYFFRRFVRQFDGKPFSSYLLEKDANSGIARDGVMEIGPVGDHNCAYWTAIRSEDGETDFVRWAVLKRGRDGQNYISHSGIYYTCLRRNITPA